MAENTALILLLSLFKEDITNKANDNFQAHLEHLKT